MMNPFPYPNPIETIKLIVQAAKKVNEFVNNWIEKKVKEVGNNKPLTKDSSATDFQETQALLIQIGTEIRTSSKELEQKINIEIDEYFEQLQFVLKTKNELLVEYNIQLSKYERDVKRFKKQCEGFIWNEVSTNLNILNPELRNILTMLPGQKKEEAIKIFIQSSLTEALASFADFFQSEVNYLVELIEDDLVIQLEKLQSQSKQTVIDFNELLNGSLQNVNDRENQILKSVLLIQSANSVNEVFEEEV